MTSKELEKWIKEVDSKLDNHLHVVTADISKIQTDLDWLKRTYWLIAGSAITAALSAVGVLLSSLT